MSELKRGELDVRVNYIKLAQWIKISKYILEKIERELDVAGIQAGLKIQERRKNKDRRKNGGVSLSNNT